MKKFEQWPDDGEVLTCVNDCLYFLSVRPEEAVVLREQLEQHFDEFQLELRRWTTDVNDTHWYTKFLVRPGYEFHCGPTTNDLSGMIQDLIRFKKTLDDN